MSYDLLKPILFRLDAENAHNLSLQALGVAEKIPAAVKLLEKTSTVKATGLDVTFCGLQFENPVGVAAGYDKNATAAVGLAALGAGHIEVGTVTVKPQAGNPRPRIFRLPEDRAVINRMGFPNGGLTAIEPKLYALAGRKGTAQIGVNIGKGKDTPLERAIDDYGVLLRRVHLYADYVTINISSPNTVGLRALQGRAYLSELLGELMAIRAQVCPARPILVKIAPDLTTDELDDILSVILELGVSGIIATNTTLSRDGLRNHNRSEKGGMSGVPLQNASTQMIRHIYKETNGKLPIIGAGGINSPASALAKIRAGASLVQVYTGLVYEGPALLSKINAGLAELLPQYGVRNISELVGTS